MQDNETKIVRLTPELMKEAREISRYMLLAHPETTAQVLPLLRLLQSCKPKGKGYDVEMTLSQATTLSLLMVTFVNDGNQARINGTFGGFMDQVESVRIAPADMPIPGMLQRIGEAIRDKLNTLRALWIALSTVARHSRKVHRIMKDDR